MDMLNICIPRKKQVKTSKNAFYNTYQMDWVMLISYCKYAVCYCMLEFNSVILRNVETVTATKMYAFRIKVAF